MTAPITVEQIFKKLPERFNPQAAQGLQCVFQFALEDADDFYIDIQPETCAAYWGAHSDPNLTLHLSEATLSRIVTGEQDGMSAFMKGQLRAEGNVILATKLGKLFSTGR